MIAECSATLARIIGGYILIIRMWWDGLGHPCRNMMSENPQYVEECLMDELVSALGFIVKGEYLQQ